MLKCPNNNCCREFNDSDVKSHWKKFNANVCYVCGTQVDWGIDASKYKPAPVVEKVVEEVKEDEDIDWASCKVSQLKEALEILGLSTKGKKTALVKRLENN